MRSVFAPLVLTLTLLIAPGFAGEAAVAEPPVLPKGINELPKDLSLRMKELIKSAEQYRGLKCKYPVACGSLNKDMLKKKMLEAFQEELPAEKMDPLEASLKMFKFIPETMVLAKYYPELLTSQVGGYYDPRRKYLVIVQNEGGLLGKELKEQYGAEIATRMEETVMVHELTHAIQDQHFNLQKFAIDDPLSDEGAARTALIEGDATLTMYNFFSNMNLEEMPMVEQIVNDMFKDPKQLMTMAPDMPGSKEMSDAPAWFRDNLLFSYMQGFVFCINVKKLGGQKLIDYAFIKDPPRSTEQIIHPEKWHTKRDDPIVITWPDLSKELSGYKKIAEGQLGEQSIRVLFRDALKNEKTDKVATEAAAGWGGDRFAVYEKDKSRVLLWITEWDSEDDSKQFEAASKQLGADWKIQIPDGKPTRVIVTRGTLAENELAAVRAAMGAAVAKAHENKPLNLAALGIDPKVKQGTDLAKALGGILDDKDGADGIAKLLNDPNMQKVLKNLGGNEKEGGLDMTAMLNDPLVQKMLKDMMKQDRPKGGVSEDGRSYSNETLGFTIQAPPSQKDWKLDGKPPAPLSVVISDPQGAVQINIAAQNLPIAMPIESLGPMIEIGPKMAMEDFKKISGDLMNAGGKKGYELQYEASAGGQKLRATQRVYILGNTMVVVSAMGPVESWNKHEKTIKETLDTFKFTEPKPAPKSDKRAKEPLQE